MIMRMKTLSVTPLRKGTRMTGLIRISAIAAALVIAAPVQAQDLKTIYQQALRNDPSIREAEANMLATMEQYPQARANLLPQLSFGGRWQTSESDGITSDTFNPDLDVTTETDQTSWSLDLQQTLFNSDQWRRMQSAGKTAARAGVDYEVARQDLIIRVADAYFNVLAAQDSLASERAALEAIGRQLEQAERRFEVGLIAITDVKESQAAFDDSTALEIAAQRALASAKEALREVTGEYPRTLASPGNDFPLIPPEPAVEQDWVDIALQQNAELESAKIGVEISRENVAIARGNRMPTVSLDAQIGNFDSERDITDNPTDTFITTNKVDQKNKQIGISVNLPLYTGGGISAAVQEQVYLHRASRENYEKVARNTERETRDAYLGVIAEIARVRALARSVESNQTALEATEAGYDVGTRTTVDILAARDSLLKAQTQYARSKYDYLINVLKLKQAAGTLSANDVAYINNWLEIGGELDATPGRGDEPDIDLTAPSAEES